MDRDTPSPEDDDQPHRGSGDQHHGPAAGRDDPTMSLTESPSGARVIHAGAVLDASAAVELRHEFNALLARSDAPLVLDLRGVRALESKAAAGILRYLAAEAGDADVDFRVVKRGEADPVAHSAFAGDPLFEVYPTLDAALEGHHRRD